MPTEPEGGRAAWHVRDAADVLAELESSRERGLSADEAARRLEREGPNRIAETGGRSPLAMVAAQFADFMIVVLLAAAVVSGALGETTDAIAILVILVLNAAIGATQEYRAQRAVESLREMAAPHARARREGQWRDVAAAELVPGDVVALEAGNVVGADLRLLEVAGLRIDEAPLTGESQPVDKDAAPVAERDVPLGDRVDMAYSGTLVTSGRGEGVVVATGMRTEIGSIAGLLQSGGSVKTPLQRRLARFGQRLALVVLLICALIFAAGLLRGQEPLLMFLTAVSLAVAAIPEALPAVVTVSLALGARKMARRHALVRRLPAVETLGSVTYVCADKTGTLTQNRMRVAAAWAEGTRVDALPDGDSAPWAALARAFALNNDAEQPPGGEAPHGDPTEVALLEAAEAAGYARDEAERAAPRIAEVAFDSQRKRMTTVHDVRDRGGGGGALLLVKGAPEAVLPLCAEARDGDAFMAAERLAAGGYRVLAFAERSLRDVAPDSESIAVTDHEQDLHLLGLAALEDPPREEAAESVRLCVTAGITPVMITGDHPATAISIARRLGIVSEDDEVVTGADLENMTAAELEARARTARVYARISPKQKLDIVRSLQANGEYVAMTGDGVNDAPALDRAEIGIAMGRQGTDVAREAADMVLLDDDFSTIVVAVREGRRVFDNVKKFVKYTMTSNSGEIWTLTLAPFLGLPLPLLPVQILWVNLVTDGVPGLAFAAEPEERRVMSRPPRPPGESIFAGGLASHVIVIGLLIAALSLAGQAWSYHAGSDHWRSVVFTVLTLCQLAHALVIRSDRESLFSLGLRSNLPLLAAVAGTVGLQLAALYVPFMNRFLHTTPLPARELAVCFLLPLVIVVAVELEKLLVRRGLLHRDKEETPVAGKPPS